MAGNAKMTIFIGGDNSEFLKKWNETKRALRRGFGGDAMALSDSLATGLAGAAAALGVLGLASIKLAADMQATRTAFATLLGDADKAKELLGDLEEFASQTPFELPGLVTAAKKLLAFGFAARDIIPIMAAVGDAAAMLGIGQEGIDRMTLAIGQMQAKGKVSGEEMRQLAEAGVPAWKFLADAIGTDIPTAMKLAEKGAIDSTTGINAILLGMQSRFKGGMEGLSKEIPGLFSTIKDNVASVMRGIGDELIKALNIKEKMQAMADYLNGFSQYVKENGLSAALRDLIPEEVLLAGFTLLGALIGGATLALVGLAIAAISAAGPLAVLIPLGAAVGAIAWEVWRNWEPLCELFGAYWDSIVLLFTDAWNSIAELVDEGIRSVADLLDSGWNAVGEGNASTWNGIVDDIDTAWVNIKNLVKAGINWIIDKLSPLSERLAALLPDGSELGVTIAKTLLPDSLIRAAQWFSDESAKITDNVSKMGTALGNLKLGFSKVDIAGKLPKPKAVNTTFSGLTNPGSATSDAGQGDKEGEKAWDKLVQKAEQVHKELRDLWIKTTLTELDQLELWKADELATLEETKEANEHYQQDITMLEAVYSVRRKKILDEEAKKRNSVWDQAVDLARSLQNKLGGIGLTGVAKQKFDLETDAAAQIDAVNKKYRDLALDYSQATAAIQQEMRDAWTANGIEFAITAAGQVDFSRRIAAEVVAIERDKQQKIQDLHVERVQFEEALEEARKDGDVARFQELLNKEQALLARDLTGKQEYIDEYYAVWKDAHRSTMSYMAEGLGVLYSGTKDLFAGILDGTKSIGEAFQDLGKKVLKMINDWIAQWLAARILLGITGQLAGATSTSDAYNGSGVGAAAASYFASHVSTFAGGGNYSGGVALVGEKGPELIHFNTGGRIYTASETQDLLAGNSYQLNMPITVSGDGGQQLAGRIREAVSDLVRQIIYEEARA